MSAEKMLPDGWAHCCLEECIKLIDYRGRTPEKTSSGIQLITAKNVKLGYLQYEPQEFIAEDNYDIWMKRGIPKFGDIIFTTEAPLGNVAQINTYDKLAFAQRIIVMQPDKAILTQDFLKYLLLSDNLRAKIFSKATGATVQGIKARLLRKIPISFPPLTEQKRIVAILDEAFQAIDRAKENAEKNLANAREVFDGYLNQVFSNPGKDWEEKKISDVSENLDYKRIPITKGIRDKGDIPYYGASGIVDYVKDFIFDEDLLCVSEDGANLLARTYPIAFSISGKTWVNNHAHILRFKSMHTQKFIEYYFNAIKLDDYVSGMAQPKLNQAMLNSIPIPLPPIHEQEKIVVLFEKLSVETRRLESIYKQKLVALDELKKSILQKAFSGEL